MVKLLWYAYAKAENDDEFEVLCLKRIRTEPHFYFIYIFSLHWDMSLIHRSTTSWWEHSSYRLLISICRKHEFRWQWSRINALIDFGKQTLEQSSTRLLLSFEVQVHMRYCTKSTVLYRTVFLFTLIHMFQRIMEIEWIMISLWQYGLVRPLYGTIP